MIWHFNNLRIRSSRIRIYERERGCWKAVDSSGWSSLYVDSAISGRLSLLLGIGAKARINSQDREALEEARSSISSDALYLPVFPFFPPSTRFRGIPSNLLREIRFADRDLVRRAFIRPNRKTRTFYSVSAHETRALFPFTCIFVRSLFNGRNIDMCWDFSTNLCNSVLRYKK